MMACSTASASTLTTASFVVTMEANCDEGNVGCDDVIYAGKSKKNGSAITLKGKTLHSTCKDTSSNPVISPTWCKKMARLK